MPPEEQEADNSPKEANVNDMNVKTRGLLLSLYAVRLNAKFYSIVTGEACSTPSPQKRLIYLRSDGAQPVITSDIVDDLHRIRRTANNVSYTG